MALPGRGLHDLGDRRALVPAQQGKDRLLLRARAWRAGQQGPGRSPFGKGDLKGGHGSLQGANDVRLAVGFVVPGVEDHLCRHPDRGACGRRGRGVESIGHRRGFSCHRVVVRRVGGQGARVGSLGGGLRLLLGLDQPGQNVAGNVCGGTSVEPKSGG